MIYTVADNILSPLGIDTDSNYKAISDGISGISLIENQDLFQDSFFGSVVPENIIKHVDGLTRLEAMFCQSIASAIDHLNLDLNKTILIVSSTKGNIDTLTIDGEGVRVKLIDMAIKINDHFNFSHKPVVISNACISGVSALLSAQRLIESGIYDHAIVSGGDLLSKFVLSGFNCLKAVSDAPCQPYDEDRKGISLGEAIGTVVVSNNKDLCKSKLSLSKISGGGQSNDANHISGPSRTGEGLKLAINKALQKAGLSTKDLDYINAHGTATLFNDEMESIAFDFLGLDEVPLNSLKGYYGHTLGASGIIESIITVRQMNYNTVIASKGSQNISVSGKLNVAKENKQVNLSRVLKTASGFGGCNGAIIFEKQ
ncbi:beta-ketoacyl synthase N-terminal-like domain-containing protein [Marinigracilibium pacificum]|uniref:Beta-ketoacyl synthase n=1 Tax=Marinigracilibium pacificum TaxID=2729599 RepID=A0A848IX56_9BACT|nr:beta-ketoacyl synthase N-terminal-like domain-containing protein [Marinigracilibium pacificum]NMM47865.1 beta-ketoacyl synthase [Marinigracilibium pacificum]